MSPHPHLWAGLGGVSGQSYLSHSGVSPWVVSSPHLPWSEVMETQATGVLGPPRYHG